MLKLLESVLWSLCHPLPLHFLISVIVTFSDRHLSFARSFFGMNISSVSHRKPLKIEKFWIRNLYYPGFSGFIFLVVFFISFSKFHLTVLAVSLKFLNISHYLKFSSIYHKKNFHCCVLGLYYKPLLNFISESSENAFIFYSSHA